MLKLLFLSEDEIKKSIIHKAKSYAKNSTSSRYFTVTTREFMDEYFFENCREDLLYNFDHPRGGFAEIIFVLTHILTFSIAFFIFLSIFQFFIKMYIHAEADRSDIMNIGIKYIISIIAAYYLTSKIIAKKFIVIIGKMLGGFFGYQIYEYKDSREVISLVERWLRPIFNECREDIIKIMKPNE